ncbi:L,D-transpeptidase family protein [Streptomyces sp. NPDC002643]
MSDELTQRLRELADTATIPPPASGAEVRATALRRRRRRRTTGALAGACAAATLAAFLTLHITGDGQGHGPSAHATAPTPTAPDATAPSASSTPAPDATAPSASSTPAPDATVDLTRRVLTIADRRLPITTGTFRTPTPTGRMTVTARAESKAVPATTVGLGAAYDVKLPWVLELAPATTAEGMPTAEATENADGAATAAEGTAATEASRADATFIAGIPFNERAVGAYDVTPGWIGLRTTDAKWLYTRLREGAVVTIEGGPTTATPSPSATGPASPSPGPTSPGPTWPPS